MCVPVELVTKYSPADLVLGRREAEELGFAAKICGRRGDEHLVVTLLTEPGIKRIPDSVHEEELYFSFSQTIGISNHLAWVFCKPNGGKLKPFWTDGETARFTFPREKMVAIRCDRQSNVVAIELTRSLCEHCHRVEIKERALFSGKITDIPQQLDYLQPAIFCAEQNATGSRALYAFISSRDSNDQRAGAKHSPAPAVA